MRVGERGNRGTCISNGSTYDLVIVVKDFLFIFCGGKDSFLFAHVEFGTPREGKGRVLLEPGFLYWPYMSGWNFYTGLIRPK